MLVTLLSGYCCTAALAIRSIYFFTKNNNAKNSPIQVFMEGLVIIFQWHPKDSPVTVDATVTTSNINVNVCRQS